MMRRTMAALTILALAGCMQGGGGASCPSASARELGTVDRLIAETETNIRRGYTMTEGDGGGFNFCLGGGGDNVGIGFCTTPGREAVAIDRATEQRKLDGLVARRAALAKQVAADRAACGAGA